MVAGVASGRIRAFTDTAINVVDVRDVAAGHLLAYERGRSGERYLLGGEDVTLRDAFAMIARHAGRTPPRVGRALARGARRRVGGGSRTAARRAASPSCSTSTRRAWLARRCASRSTRPSVSSGYTFRSADEALADAVAWFAR